MSINVSTSLSLQLLTVLSSDFGLQQDGSVGIDILRLILDDLTVQEL